MDKEGLGLGLEITELRLGLPGAGNESKSEKKRVFAEVATSDGSSTTAGDDRKTQTKSQVVGWPPVCSHRRKNSVETPKVYVKVSMDGEPFLRKIDLNVYKGYSDLAVALKKLFNCHGIGEADRSEYLPIYEDKDGDWMLAGDVPWEMFIETCKRVRIMKKPETKGFELQDLKEK